MNQRIVNARVVNEGIGAEKQVVDAGFGSNALILQRPNLKQLHFFRSREVQYMQLGAEFFRKTYGQ